MPHRHFNPFLGSLSRPLRSLFPFSPSRPLPLLLFSLWSLASFSSLPSLSFSASPSPPLGPCEILFKNGKTVRGAVLSIDGDRFRFKPYDAEAFTLPLALVKETRPIDAAASLRERAAALAKSGDLQAAIALLNQAPPGDPGIQADLAAYVSQAGKLRLKDRDADFILYRKQYDAFLDKRQPAEALEAARHFLLEHPGDADALGDALSAEFRVHRSQARPAGAFSSLYIDQLRKLAPDSGALRAVEAEMNVSKNLQAKFVAERETFLASALEEARNYYKDFQLESAIETLERALGFGPPADQAAEFSSLLAKAKAEYEAEKADDRADEAKRLATLRANKFASSPGAPRLSARQAEKYEKRRDRRKKEPKRPRP